MAVLYTTHYMEEAEHLCDRVGIIDHGKLIAEGTRRELVGLVGERDHVSLGATGDLAATAQTLAALPGVHEAGATEDGIALVVDDARGLLPEILARASDAGATIKTVEVTEPDLEAVFLHLTGRALRD
jgi:ABC-2 type transport system ATP-binding protein